MTALQTLFQQIAAQIYGYSYVQAAILAHGGDLNDVSYSGDFFGQTDSESFSVQIDSVGANDTFSWKSSKGAGDNVLIVANTPILLTDNIFIKFIAITGHTIGDQWTYNIESQSSFKFVHLWNDDVAAVLKEQPEEYPFPVPAAFIEWSLTEPKQLGLGVQIYDPLDITIHILAEEIDSGDGNLDQAFSIYDLSEEMFSGNGFWDGLSLFKPDQCVAFVRTAEDPPFGHGYLLHLIQKWRTNLVDPGAKFPRRTIKTQPTDEVTNRIPAP